MSKYITYNSDEFREFIRIYSNLPEEIRLAGFTQWAMANNIIVRWAEYDRFMEFENEKIKLAFFLKWC